MCRKLNIVGKLFIAEPCGQNAAKLLSVNKNQLKTTIEFLTEYTNVKNHLYKIEAFKENLVCRMYNKGPEIALQIREAPVCTRQSINKN